MPVFVYKRMYKTMTKKSARGQKKDSGQNRGKMYKLLDCHSISRFNVEVALQPIYDIRRFRMAMEHIKTDTYMRSADNKQQRCYCGTQLEVENKNCLTGITRSAATKLLC